MSNQKFGPLVREAVWKAFGKRCLFCEKPITLGDMNLDHLIPESLSGHPEELKDLLERTGSENLDIFSLSNISPTCQTCNLKKYDLIISDRRLMLLLSIIESKQSAVEFYLKKPQRYIVLPVSFPMLKNRLTPGSLLRKIL